MIAIRFCVNSVWPRCMRLPSTALHVRHQVSHASRMRPRGAQPRSSHTRRTSGRDATRRHHTAACGRGGPFDKLVGMKAYSGDLRIRVMDAVDRGMPQAEVSSLVRVSVRSIKRWRHRPRERGQLGESPRAGRTGQKLVALRAGLLLELEAHPDAPLAAWCQWWEETQG